ncbi:unannotated protein [freshwater metagenome]|uniref:Unannotated protein n=1 Tax=freshwater metagenome TaxID=449393 RepID=A0A6J5YID3_9ZZZZ
MADLGVDGIGEIDGGSTLRKGDDTTLRREDEHLVLFEVDLEVRHELVWIRGLLLPIDDSIEPGQISGALVVVLVVPVRRHTELGPLVHLQSADLHLEGFGPGADHRGVQGLIQVELRHRYVILEPTLDRLPCGVDRAESRVTVLHCLDDDPDADEVEDVVEITTFHHHLLVDAPEVFGPASDVGDDVQLIETGTNMAQHLVEKNLSLRRSGGHHVVDLGVTLRVQ